MSKQVYCPRCGEKITLHRNPAPYRTKSKKQRQRVVSRLAAAAFGILLFACLAMCVTNSFPTF